MIYFDLAYMDPIEISETETAQSEHIHIDDEDEGWRTGLPLEVIDTPDKVDSINKILNEYFTDTYTRNFAWTAMSRDMLTHPSPALAELLSQDLEAVASLKGTGIPELDDCYVVCFGRNAPDRQAAPGKTEHDLSVAKNIFSQPPTHKTQEEQQPTSESDHVTVQYERITASSNPDLVAQFKALYVQDTPYAEDYLTELMRDETNIFFAAVRTDVSTGKHEVVCTGSALSIPWALRKDAKDFTLLTYEITGARVKTGYAGKRYYQGVLNEVMRSLATSESPVHLAFGFSNLDQPAVQAAARNQGRHSMFEPAAELHLEVKSIRQHAHYFGELTDYNLTYIAGDELRSRYASPAFSSTSGVE